MVAASKFLKSTAFLAYGKVSDPNFRMLKVAEKKTVDLGPFYLVWELKEHPELGNSLSDMPYQLQSVDVVL